MAVWLWPAAETEPQRPNSAADPAAATDPAPDPYLAACQTYYTGADGREYHVFTAVTPSIEGRTDPVGYRSELIPAGGTVDFPATVMVEDAVTQDYAAEDFAALLDSWDVSVTAPEGVSRVKLWDAEEETPESPALLYRRLRADPTCTHNEVVWTLRMKSGDVLHLTMTVEFEEQQALRITPEDAPLETAQELQALLYRRLRADPTCTHNEVVWTLRMKSGDVLHLTMTVEFEEQQALRITPEDAPLETAQELQALLDRLAEEYNADTSITVELPDVTYDAPVSVGCAVTLKGSGTTFAAPVTVTPLSDTERCHAYVRFSEVSFEGDGSGTGVTARAPTYLENCRVTGWDVGALAVNGGWVYLHGGYIGGNGVGARYDSAYSNSYTYTIRHIDFLNNTTALELLCLPPNSYAALDDCRFRGNGTDVYNPGGYRIEVNNGTEVTL
mgnify:CR=1 FL=1